MMPRSSSVSEDVWENAIRAVKVEKLSLRRAAQRYGVHHMSLHRRIRGRTLSPYTTIESITDFCMSPSDEAEALAVLRDQFIHTSHVRSDDVRMVVRAVASQSGCRPIPPTFPSNDWIKNFKRKNGLTQNSSDTIRSNNQNPYRSNVCKAKVGCDESLSVSSNESCDGVDSGTSLESAGTDSNDIAEDGHRGYRLSYTVPPEIWVKAIASVEEDGMSLRAAAKLYGVHFAALHRRIKKRARNLTQTHCYFQQQDEALIVEIITAHAHLGVRMAYEELRQLIRRAALQKIPNITVDSARELISRFHERNQSTIRHLIQDWPSSEDNLLNERKEFEVLPVRVQVVPSLANALGTRAFSQCNGQIPVIPTLPISLETRQSPFRILSTAPLFQHISPKCRTNTFYQEQASPFSGIASIAETVMTLQHGDSRSDFVAGNCSASQ